MTYGELKETETYINAKDIEINVNMEESIDEEYFYVDEFCLLDDLQVIGTANMADGTLHIDLVCTNWNKRFEPDWIPESRQIQIFKGRFCMLKGKKVYDPLTNTWSTGYWLPIYDNRGYIVQYVPVWKD